MRREKQKEGGSWKVRSEMGMRIGTGDWILSDKKSKEGGREN